MKKLLQTQLRVLGALVLRETRATFGTSQLGYLWAIITPALGVAVFVAVFGAAGRRPPFGASLALFFATGMLTLEFYKKLSAALMTTFNANKALLTYPVIKEIDTLCARATLISATYLLIMIAFFGTMILFGQASFPHHPDQLILAFAMTSLLGAGMGMLNAVMLSVWESWIHVESILTRPLIIVSGVFYIPSNLPTAAVEILKWNPVLHLIEWIRTGYYSNYASTVLDKGYLFWFVLLAILFGLVGERLTRKRRAGQ